MKRTSFLVALPSQAAHPTWLTRSVSSNKRPPEIRSSNGNWDYARERPIF